LSDVAGRLTLGDSIAGEKGRKLWGAVPTKLKVFAKEKTSRFENGSPNTGLSKLLNRVGWRRTEALFAAAILRNWASVSAPPFPEGEPELCSAASEKQRPRKTTTGRSPRLVIR
jgi:hypothetical protein